MTDSGPSSTSEPRPRSINVPSQYSSTSHSGRARSHSAAREPISWRGPINNAAVHRIHGDAVGRGEFPVREDGLDDLETVGEPADAVKQCGIIHVRRRRGGKPDDDFRFDLRL